MNLRNIILATSVGLLGFQLANAAPEDDYPDFYTSVPWSIPAELEAFTVPTTYAPTANTKVKPKIQKSVVRI